MAEHPQPIGIADACDIALTEALRGFNLDAHYDDAVFARHLAGNGYAVVRLHPTEEEVARIAREVRPELFDREDADTVTLELYNIRTRDNWIERTRSVLAAFIKERAGG
jgi:hypothetical protein